MGLCQASVRFDELLGFQFLTFVISAVIIRMKRFLREQNSTIRILRNDWNKRVAGKYLTFLLDGHVSDDNEANLESIIPADLTIMKKLLKSC